MVHDDARDGPGAARYMARPPDTPLHDRPARLLI
jgi:hypothetical protein